jgi:hypothetical protein
LRDEVPQASRVASKVIRRSDVLDHYVRQYGVVTKTYRFVGGLRPVVVLEWSARAETGGVTLYATLSDGAVGPSRTEFYLGLQPAVDRAALLLAGLVDYPSTSGEILADGHTVPSDGPLWEGSELSAFLFRERGGSFGPLGDTESHVHFLLAIPLFEAERRCKVANGAEALFDAWRRRLVNFSDPFREPVEI